MNIKEQLGVPVIYTDDAEDAQKALAEIKAIETEGRTSETRGGRLRELALAVAALTTISK